MSQTCVMGKGGVGRWKQYLLFLFLHPRMFQGNAESELHRPPSSINYSRDTKEIVAVQKQTRWHLPFFPFTSCSMSNFLQYGLIYLQSISFLLADPVLLTNSPDSQNFLNGLTFFYIFNLFLLMFYFLECRMLWLPVILLTLRHPSLFLLDGFCIFSLSITLSQTLYILWRK